MDRVKNICSSFMLSVTSFSSHTSGARGLKFGTHNPYMNAFKVTNQIFDILPRSWDISVQSFAVNLSGGDWVARKGLAFFPVQKMSPNLVVIYLDKLVV